LSRAGYYKGKKQKVKKICFDKQIISQVLKIRQEQPCIGSKKLYHLLFEELHKGDQKLGRDRFHRLLSEYKLLVRRKRRHVHTTNSHHRFYTYGNLLKTKKINSPEQVYVADITYLRTHKGFVYLFLLTDAYSRKIMGWNVSNSLGIEGGIKALKMALKNTKRPTGVIHHSDRGIQYCSHVYTDLIKKNNMNISMTEENHCYENAIAERVNGILKQEFFLDSEWPDCNSVIRAVRESVEIYNTKRPHWSNSLKTPEEVHQAA